MRRRVIWKMMEEENFINQRCLLSVPFEIGANRERKGMEKG